MTVIDGEVTHYDLFFERIEIMLDIGIHDFERGAPQLYRIDLELEVTTAVPLPQTRIVDVVDYDRIMNKLREMARGRYDLQEHFAHELTQFLLAIDNVRAVTCRVGKPAIFSDVGNVGIVLKARRGDVV